MIVDGYTCTVYCAHPRHGKDLPKETFSQEWNLGNTYWGLDIAASSRAEALASLRKRGWRVVTLNGVQDLVCPQCVRLRPTWRKDLRAPSPTT